MLEDLYTELKEQLDPSMFQPKSEEELMEGWIKAFNRTKNSDGSYSTNRGVDLDHMGFTKLPIRFKYVGREFSCMHNNLVTLKGSPSQVGVYFFCGHNRLVTLTGGPKWVGDSYYCNDNNLTTLEGAPEYVRGDFHAVDNPLESLDGLGEVKGQVYHDKLLGK